MDYREADELVFSIIKESKECLTKRLRETKYPKTYIAMQTLIAKTASLKLVMFDLLDELNLYSFKVIFRSYIEHYLKFLYIWLRLLKEETDDVGKDYYDYCGAQEVVDYAKALHTAESILDKDALLNYTEFTHKVFPGLDNISKKNMEAKSNNFRYRNIIRYIANNSSELIHKQSPFLTKTHFSKTRKKHEKTEKNQK